MNKLLLLACVATFSATCFAQDATRQPTGDQPINGTAGTLKIVTGDVRVVGTDYEERKVQPGDRIASTERLLTGKDSSASLVLRDGTMLALGPRTNIDLRRFTYDSTTQEGSLAVQIVRGSMRMISGLIGKTRPESVAISTRTTTVGIRGTDIIVSVDEDLP